MTIEELRKEYQDKIDALKEEFNDKIAKLQEKEKESNKRWWKPEVGEQYYYITQTGYVMVDTYNNDCIDKEYYNFHNMFQTEEEAEFAAERWKVMRELEILADDDRKWNGVNDHYAINHIVEYGHGVVVRVDYFLFDRTQPFYFKSAESAERAIDTIGQERLEKYWFGIKEE